MSTRSNVAVQFPDGSVLSTNCHFDGYLKGVGAALFARITTQEQAKRLIEKGELRFINIDNLEYYKDGAAEAFSSYDEYVKGVRTSWAEYLYIFKGGQWYYSNVEDFQSQSSMKPLAAALGKTVVPLIKIFAEEQIKSTRILIERKQKNVLELQLAFTKHCLLEQDVEVSNTYILLQNAVDELNKLQIELDAFTATHNAN